MARFQRPRCSLLLPLWLLFSWTAPAQVSTRTEEIEAARDKKAQQLQPDTPSGTEQFLVEFQRRRILERITAGVYGIRLAFGGLATGSGFALGAEYLRPELANGQAVFHGSIRGSIRRYHAMDLGFSLPKLAGEKISLDLYARRRDSPQMAYFGPGPNSRKSDRSNFRLEDTSYDTTFAVRPARYVKVGATGGYLQTNVGPGTDKRYISSEIIFPPAGTPGIDQQANFLRYGFFFQIDNRDFPGESRRGGIYSGTYSIYSDRKLDLYSFRRLDVELQQYIPFFNARRVIALRGKTSLAYTDSGQKVPFYLQPTVGGSDDLRGYRFFRFYDDNSMVLNAEYRWETFSGLDMAIFADAGKVFPRRSDLNFRNLKSSVGFGLRFNIRNSVFLRTDVGFSHEGFQVWVKFNNVF
jgi:outer membrane protein assembly factor BamA